MAEMTSASLMSRAVHHLQPKPRRQQPGAGRQETQASLILCSRASMTPTYFLPMMVGCMGSSGVAAVLPIPLAPRLRHPTCAAPSARQALNAYLWY